MAKILIIDDDPDMVLAAQMTLEAAGHDIYTAASGTEGLEKIKEVRPDLIILDVMMDTTTEGFHVSLQLRSPDAQSEYKEFKDIPIIMLTAIHTTTPLRFGPEQDYLPVDVFLDKPLDPDVLLAKVEELLAD
jgi:CheY-like chemotaxis protein